MNHLRRLPIVALLIAAGLVSLSWADPDHSGNASPSGDIRFVEGFSVRAAVTLVADQDGILQIDRDQPILIGSATTPPPPPPPPPPPTDPPTDPTDPPEPPGDPLALKVSTLLAKAPTDKAGRSAMASLYRTIGQLSLTDPQQIRQSTDLMLFALPLSAEWKKWNADVATFAVALSIDEIKRAWGLIAEGLE